MSDAIRRELEKLLPPGAILPEAVPPSWPEGAPPPAAILAPDSESQVASVLDRASREGWRVLPAGLCTWLGGTGAPEVDLVLSTRNLREMGIYEPADLTFTAGAGIPWESLRMTTEARGQWLPLDPPGVGAGSLGGMVATGASGPLRQAYGAPRDHVLGVTMVSGDGRILKWGGRVVKNVAGFDVTRLSIGSRGTLGVITSVSCRLFPLPETDVTLLLKAPWAEDLLPVAREMALSPLPLSAVELLDPMDGVWPPGRGNSQGGGELGAGRPGSPGAGGAALALRILASEPQGREMEARVRGAISGSGVAGGDPPIFLRGPESGAFHDALGGWEEGAALVLRLSLLPSRMSTLWAEARELAGPFGPLGMAAHMGWGVLRVVFPRVPSEAGELGVLARALGDLRCRLEGAGGSLTLSQGPLELLGEVGPWGEPGPEGTLMRGLKEEFDPAGILSPGGFGS